MHTVIHQCPKGLGGVRKAKVKRFCSVLRLKISYLSLKSYCSLQNTAIDEKGKLGGIKKK